MSEIRCPKNFSQISCNLRQIQVIFTDKNICILADMPATFYLTNSFLQNSLQFGRNHRGRYFIVTVIRPASGDLDFAKKTYLYDRILKTSEPICMNIMKFLTNVYEFYQYEDARSAQISTALTGLASLLSLLLHKRSSFPDSIVSQVKYKEMFSSFVGIITMRPINKKIM